MILPFVYKQGYMTFTNIYDISSIKFSVLKYMFSTLELVIEIMRTNNYENKFYFSTIVLAKSKNVFQLNKKLTKRRAIDILNSEVDVGHVPEFVRYDYFHTGTYEIILSQEIYI